MKKNINITIVLKKIVFGLLTLVLLLVSACTDSTGGIGIPPSNEALDTDMETFNVFSRSEKIDSISSRSSASYLGSIYDMETEGRLVASFATQFAILENVKYFPNKSSVLSVDEYGNATCDSVLLQLNFDTYYGDVNTPMKIAIYPLNPKTPLCEDSTYYTTTDLKKYIHPDFKDKPIATKVFTAWDRIHGSDPSNTSSSSYPSIRIPLPVSEGRRIMDKYWEYVKDNEGLSPEAHVNRNFDDSYHFIRNVLPGYYAEIVNGEGVMVRVFVDALYIIYKTRPENSEGGEPVSSYSIFAGTPEVVQSCQFQRTDVDRLLDDQSCTWLKTPSGICTEVELPIDDIFSGTHKNDSISRVMLTLSRYNDDQNVNQFGIPQNLLLLRKDDVKNFFKENRLPDEKTSYIASYQTGENVYAFQNLSQIVTYIYKDRQNAVNVYIKDVLKKDNPTPEEIEDATYKWTEENPNWNKCYVIPISATTNTSSGIVTGVSHDLSMTSARLVKGTKENPIRVQVFYTRVASGPDND